LKLGTRLTFLIALIIVVVLSGYGYFHISSRRDILIRKMKIEVKSMGQTLGVSLEKLSRLKDAGYIQDIIDAVEEYEKTLGVVVYHKERDLVFLSRSLRDGQEPYLELIKRTIREDSPVEEFGLYNKKPIFSYTFPFKNRKGKNIGGVSILQDTSSLEEEIERAKGSIFITIVILIGGTVGLVLAVTRRWITLPISQLMMAIKNLARGHLGVHVDLKKGSEFFELAQAFNQMAVDLKEAQERIIQQVEKKLELERSLRQSEKLATIGQLASGLAHEIGTPLHIIGGRAEWMKKKVEDKETVIRNLDLIIQQTGKITKNIEQLLGFVRKKNPEQVPVHVKNLLESTVDFLEAQIQKQRVSVKKDFQENLPPTLGDPDQLQQVFLNVILNAIQAMPQGGSLFLSAAQKWVSKKGLENGQRPYVEVSVQDTGIGMEKEVLEEIFTPFFTTKHQRRGTGLGLTVSQGIVQDHEGWIEVESEVGKGSLFKIYLPSLASNALKDDTETARNGSKED